MYSLSGHRFFRKAVCMKPGSLQPTVRAGSPAQPKLQGDAWVLVRDNQYPVWDYAASSMLFLLHIQIKRIAKERKMFHRHHPYHRAFGDQRWQWQLMCAPEGFLSCPTPQKDMPHRRCIHLSMWLSSIMTYKNPILQWDLFREDIRKHYMIWNARKTHLVPDFSQC